MVRGAISDREGERVRWFTLGEKIYPARDSRIAAIAAPLRPVQALVNLTNPAASHFWRFRRPQISGLTGKLPQKNRIERLNPQGWLSKVYGNQILRSRDGADRRRENREFSAAETGKNLHNREITGKRQPIARTRPPIFARSMRCDLGVRMVTRLSSPHGLPRGSSVISGILEPIGDRQRHDTGGRHHRCTARCVAIGPSSAPGNRNLTVAALANRKAPKAPFGLVWLAGSSTASSRRVKLWVSPGRYR